jgi:hypothetical protein
MLSDLVHPLRLAMFEKMAEHPVAAGLQQLQLVDLLAEPPDWQAPCRVRQQNGSRTMVVKTLVVHAPGKVMVLQSHDAVVRLNDVQWR